MNQDGTFQEGETREWHEFVRWNDGSRTGGNFFIRRLKGGSYFDFGTEVRMEAMGYWHEISSVGYDNDKAADLIRRIAEFNGLEVDIRPKTE